MLCHFQGGKALLSYNGCLEAMNSADNGLSSFAISIFATMDLVHSLLSGEEPFFDEAWVMTRPHRQSWWGCLGDDDPFLVVLCILFRLARLGHEARQSQTPVSIADLLSIQSALERCGEKCCSHPAASPASATDPPAARRTLEESWATFCTAYRSTALIYMYRALCNLAPDHDLVQKATDEGARAICNDHLAGNIAHCMLFPILIIGSHCLDHQQRTGILKALSTNAAYLSFKSIPLIDQFLKEKWCNGIESCSWWQSFADIAYRTAVF